MRNEPGVIARYRRASDERDVDALVACFSDDATVIDEGETYVGPAAIRRWREGISSRYTYTATVGDVTQSGDGEYLVPSHLVGDFPGGVADIEYSFGVRDGLIRNLVI